jgi:subtilase family serine protease
MSISHAGVVRAVGLAGLAALSIGSWIVARDAHGSQPVPTSAASPSGFVRLERGKHPLARPEFDIGPLDPGKRIANLSLVFKPSPAQLQERDALLAAQVDPTSPSYRSWITTAEYAARFGARPADIARASAWLAAQGLDVKATSPLGARVTFSGTVAQLQSAFRTPMRQYRVGGETHYAMATAPAIPADLADVVLAVHNTHDFYPHPMLSRKKLPLYNDPMAGEGIGPPDWATIYDVTPLYTTGVSGTPIDGTGVTVAVVGVAQIAQSDVDAFRTLFGLPASTVTMTLVPNTGASAAGQQGSGAEAILDVEWSGAIAKGATVDYVYVGEDDGNVDDATYYAIEQNLASVISESWGGCEQGLTASDADVVGAYGSAANLLGITYMVAAGDTGAGGCLDQPMPVAGLYADIPASFPGATAVGGTGFPSGAVTFDTNGYATGYSSSETVWNDVPHGGVGGGGISIVFPRPAYQSALAACAPVGTLPLPVSNMRQLPDVAVSAGGGALPYFAECTGDNTTMDCAGTGGGAQVFPITGTSASSPSFASVVALMNQAAGGRLGNINPQLYAIESATPAPFHDITIGNNEVPCQSGTDLGCPSGGEYGFPATTGYDCASGLGSIDGVNLVKAFSSLVKTSTTMMASPTTTTAGADVSLSATVDVTGTSASTLGGTVAFVFQSYDTSGGFDLSWTLGTSAIMSPTTMGGSASIAPMPIPVGLVNPAAQYVDVYAMYSGDAAHLPSVSPKVRITFGPVSFCVSPALSNIAVAGKLTFTGMGGMPPVKWYVGYDSTCDQNGNCSTIDETTGAFTAGPTAGYVTVTGLDSYGAEAVADVVAGDAADTGAPPWTTPATCGVVADAGPDGAAHDSGATDSGEVLHDDGGPGSSVKAGCGCETAGRGGSPAGLLAGAALGLGIALARRRRSDR